MLPSKKVKLRKSLIGHKMNKVTRQILKDDMTQENYEQVSDGPVEFVIDNSTVVSFSPLTEAFSVCVANDKMPQYGDSYLYKNVTDNSFWKHRVDRTIKEVAILKSVYATKENPMEFGIAFKFENGTDVCIQFIDTEDFPDTLRVIETSEASEYTEKSFRNW